MAITLGVDIGLFKAMLENNASPKTVNELADTVNVDASLLGKSSLSWRLSNETEHGDSTDYAASRRHGVHRRDRS